METHRVAEYIDTNFAYYYQVRGVVNEMVELRMVSMTGEEQLDGVEYGWRVPLSDFDQQDYEKVVEGATGEVHGFFVTYPNSEPENITMFSVYPSPSFTNTPSEATRAWVERVMQAQATPYLDD